MKKLLLTVPILFAFLILVDIAEAHFLATDKNIGAVLHVDPTDEPVVGAQTSFFFEFKDKDNKFNPENCDCSFNIFENGRNVYSQPLFQTVTKPSLTNAAVFYTFSEKGAYEIRVSGKPNSANKFSSFNLKWNLRVEKTKTGQDLSGNNNSSFLSTHLVHLVLIVGASVVFIFLLLKNRKPKTRSKGGGK